MRSSGAAALLVPWLLAGLPAASAAGPVALPSGVPFVRPDEVPARVREHCALPARILEAVREHAGDASSPGAPPDPERRLELRIRDVHAPGGGAWSGPKWISLEGELVEGSRRVAFHARRASLGGPLAPMLDTCEILSRCADALGRDVAGWLRAPRDGARLGDPE